MKAHWWIRKVSRVKKTLLHLITCYQLHTQASIFTIDICWIKHTKKTQKSGLSPLAWTLICVICYIQTPVVNSFRSNYSYGRSCKCKPDYAHTSLNLISTRGTKTRCYNKHIVIILIAVQMNTHTPNGIRHCTSKCRWVDLNCSTVEIPLTIIFNHAEAINVNISSS